MAARAEITKKYAKVYAEADKKTKSVILVQVCDVTGWSRDNARRRLAQARRRGVKHRKPGPKPGTTRYSYDSLKVLQRVWSASGGMCGKYLAAAMAGLLDNMEAHGHLVYGQGRYSVAVRAELEAMSAATIDRYLASTKARAPLRGKSTTKPGSLLRQSITIRKAGDQVGSEPGFFEVDTVAHCGPTLKGEFARSVNYTDINIGWTYTRAIRNNAHSHIKAAMEAFYAAIPYQIQGLDCDNGSEFLNHVIVAWAASLDIFFTRARPYRKNDQAVIETKNNHLVRRYGMYWRYDTPTELDLLNQLWALVNDRLNYFTPTIKPTGWTTDRQGRRKRVYDKPRTPLDRLLTAGVLSATQQTGLIAYRDSLDALDIARRIDQIQQQLIRLAAAKTRRLEDQTRPRPPDPSGIKHAGRKQ